MERMLFSCMTGRVGNSGRHRGSTHWPLASTMSAVMSSFSAAMFEELSSLSRLMAVLFSNSLCLSRRWNRWHPGDGGLCLHRPSQSGFMDVWFSSFTVNNQRDNPQNSPVCVETACCQYHPPDLITLPCSARGLFPRDRAISRSSRSTALSIVLGVSLKSPTPQRNE